MLYNTRVYLQIREQCTKAIIFLNKKKEVSVHCLLAVVPFVYSKSDHSWLFVISSPIPHHPSLGIGRSNPGIFQGYPYSYLCSFYWILLFQLVLYQFLSDSFDSFCSWFYFLRPFFQSIMHKIPTAHRYNIKTCKTCVAGMHFLTPTLTCLYPTCQPVWVM